MARGSSDHVATCLNYASEILAGLPVASLGRSVVSVYHVPLRLSGAACLSISQSGASLENVQIARAKQGPGAIFLATDAMATAGSDIDGFTLNGRRITRRDGRLTLADGTLAGADLDIGRALRTKTHKVGLAPGARATYTLLDPDLTVARGWR